MTLCRFIHHAWLGGFILLNSLNLQAQSLLPVKTKSLSNFKEQLIQYDTWLNHSPDLSQKGWKAYARYIEFNRTRLNPDGTLPDQKLVMDALKEVQSEKLLCERMKNGAGWSPVGPIERPESTSSSPSHGMGRVNCIAFHPTDPLTYWVGVAQGGVWKTTDGGETYSPLTDQLPILRISDIAVNPNNPDNIFLSVCDYAYIGVALNTDGRKRHTHYGIGVYRTDDGGITWQPTGLTFEQNGYDATLIRRVLIHPTQPGVLLAGGVSGIFRSVDDGASWEKVRDVTVWDFEQDFNQGAVVYATTGRVRNVGGGPATMLKSNDFGVTWAELPIGFPADESIGRTEIGLTPESSDYIYVVATDPSGGFYALYRSIDAGATWEVRNSYQNEGLNILHWSKGNSTGGQGWYDLAILVDPKNKERLFVGGINMWTSSNGGQTWNPVTYWVMYHGFTLHADQHQYKYNPLDQKYYACTDGGVARTSEIIAGSWNDNYNWPTHWEERSNGMIITSFYRIGLSEMFPGYVIGGAQDNSTFYDRNGHWINFIGGDGMDCMIHPDDPSIVWGSSQYGSLVRSDDGGGGFKGIRPTSSEKGGWTTPMAMDQNNPNRIFTGYGNVYRSDNKGDSWTKLSNFPVISGYGKPAIISALALYPANSSTIYIAKRMHYPYITTSSVWATHNSNQWEEITAGLPDSLYFTALAVDDNDSLSVWITCAGFLNGAKVYHSSDGGHTWQNQSWNLPNIPVNVVVHQNGSNNDVVYIGTDAGVYYTYNGLNEWILYSTQLPNVIVSDLEIHYPTQKLFAGTFGRGIWMTDLVEPASGVNNPPFQNNTMEIYPNPASGFFNLRADGLQNHEVCVDLISITGSRVWSRNYQVSQQKLTAEVPVNVPRGIYFVRLWDGKRLRTARITVQ